MEGLARVVERACSALLWVAVACGMLMTAFVVLASLMRYLVGAPFRFTEELVGLLFVAVGLLGLPWTTLHNRHLRITLLPERMSPAWRSVAEAVSMAMMLVFCTVFGMVSWEFAATSLMLDSRTDMGGIPLFPWMAIMPVTCGAVVVALFFYARRRWSGGETPVDGGPPVA